MELFILGIALGVGTAKGKEVTKAVAKGYMTLADKTKSAVDSIREDMRAAVEEAHDDQEREENAPLLSESDNHAETLALQEAAEQPHDLYDTTHDFPVTEPAHVVTASAPITTSATVGRPKRSLNFVKGLAKSYVAVAEKAKSATANARENMRDAIEEARYEREQEAQRKTQHRNNAETVVAEVVTEAPAVIESQTSSAPKKTQATGTKKSAAVVISKTSTDDTGVTTRKTTVRSKSTPKNGQSERDTLADVALEVAEVAMEVL